MGNILMAYTEQTRISGGLIAGAQNPQNASTVAIESTDQYEGQSQIELLAQILIELRILNQQMNDLPLLLLGGILPKDTPEEYRNDPSFANINRLDR